MSSEKPHQSFQGHRVACDECSQRKVRCTSDGPGACHNCILWGEPCTYSPKVPVGRPRKRRPTANSNSNEKYQPEHKKPTSKSLHPQPIIPKKSSHNGHDPNKESNPANVATSSSSLSSMTDLTTPVSESSVQVRSVDVGDLLLDQQRGLRGECGDDFTSYMVVDEDVSLSCKPIHSQYKGGDAWKSKQRASEPSTSRPSLDTFGCRTMSQNDLFLPTSPSRSTNPNSNSEPAASEIPAISRPKPGRRSSSSLTFTTLLNTVVCLRSKYDSLMTVVGSCAQRATPASYSNFSAIADDVVVSASSFYDEIEPYLFSLLDANSSESNAILYDGFNEIQTIICLIITASSTILDATRTLHNLHNIVLARNGSGSVSSRLKHMLRLSPISFQVLRCQQSLGLVMGILAKAEKMGLVMTMMPVEGITRAAREAADVQQRVEQEIDKLKAPPDERTYGHVNLRSALPR